MPFYYLLLLIYNANYYVSSSFMWKSIHMYLYICLPAWCRGPNYSLIPCMKYRVQIMINHYSDKINIQNRKIQEFYKYKMTSKSSQSSHVLLKTWNVLIYWSLRLQVKKSSTFFFSFKSCMLFSSMGTHLRFYFLYFDQSQPIT